MNTTLSPEHKPRSTRNLYVLTLRALLYGSRENMVRAVWQPFVLSLGASMPFLGLLESLGGFGGIVPTAMLPLGGWLSDRRGRKTFLVAGSGLSLAGAIILALAAWTREWHWLFLGVVLLGLAAIARPAADTITAESTTPDARGRAFGLTNTFSAASGVLAPTVGGFLAQRYGFLSVLIVGVVIEVILLAVVAAVLRETLPLEGRPRLLVSEFLPVLKRAMTPPARLRSFYAAMTIDAFAFGTGATMFSGLLSKTYGFTPLQLGLIASVGSATWAISQLFIAHQVDKRGTVPFLITSEMISVVVIIGWLLAKSYTAFLAIQTLWGLAVSTWMPAFLAWLANSVPEKQRAEEMGRLGAFRGLLSFPAPFVGGLLYKAFGFKGPMLANLFGAVLVVVILRAFVREPQAVP